MQVETSAERAAPSRPAVSLYMISWLAVAAVGIGYIGVASLRPDLLGAVLPIAEPTADQTASGKTTDELTDEIGALRKWVHELQHELAATRSTLQEQVVHSSAIMQRLAAAEERLTVLQEARSVQLPAAGAAIQRVQGRAQPAGRATPAAVPQRGAEVSPPASAPALANVGSAPLNVLNAGAAPIATGSVPEAAARVGAAPSGFGPAKVVPAPANPRGIEIANGESLDGLRAKWGELSSRDAQTLGSLSPRYRLAADGRSAPFTLLAGPFDTPADATRACNTLRTRGISCRVGAYSGNAL